MSVTQQLYQWAPVPAQNALVSLYGYLRGRRRYAGAYAELEREIAAVRRLPPADVEALQQSRLAGLLDHAVSRVPYYRDLFARLGASPRDIGSAAALRTLPILTKQDVRRHAPQLLATGQRPYWSTETSGSTGTPLVIALDAGAYQLSMALVAAHESAHGINRMDRRATFAGRLVQPVGDDRPPFWRYNHAERQMLFSAYHMSDRNLPGYLEALDRFQPAEIIGYPSAIYALADYCRRSGRSLAAAPAAVITNSETLFQWQREVIEPYLRAPVYDYYGSAESVVFAGQCRHRRYHPEPLMGIAEVLDDDDQPVRPGVAGRLVCTTLANRAMPLIRYETGDAVITAADACACGRPGPTWAAVVGRNDEVVVTPEGRPVGRLDHVFKGASGIREAQVAQTAPNRLVIRIVAEGEYRKEIETTIIRNTRERVGPTMEIAVEAVAAIPRTARGKFRGVVREF